MEFKPIHNLFHSKLGCQGVATRSRLLQDIFFRLFNGQLRTKHPFQHPADWNGPDSGRQLPISTPLGNVLGNQLAGIQGEPGIGRIPPKCTLTKFDMGNGAKGMPPHPRSLRIPACSFVHVVFCGPRGQVLSHWVHPACSRGSAPMRAPSQIELRVRKRGVASAWHDTRPVSWLHVHRIFFIGRVSFGRSTLLKGCVHCDRGSYASTQPVGLSQLRLWLLAPNSPHLMSGSKAPLATAMSWSPGPHFGSVNLQASEIAMGTFAELLGYSPSHGSVLCALLL